MKTDGYGTAGQTIYMLGEAIIKETGESSSENRYYCHLHFRDQEMATWTDEVNCSRSNWKSVTDLKFKPRSASKLYALNYYLVVY